MISKCFEFKDYNHKRSEPNYTTVADFYRYCDNQNNVLKSLADCLLWQPSTDYTVGQIVRAPGMPTGHIAKCTTAGQSSEEEPAWTDGVVADGTAKWSVYDPESATDDKITTASSKKLDKIGGAITGPISYDGAPKTDIELVNKFYVLAAIKSALDERNKAIKAALDERTKAMYPVGCYFYSDDSRAPSEYIPGLEGTTWEQTAAGRVLIGAGTADSGTVYKAGDKGGEEKHQLSVEELAKTTAQLRYIDGSPVTISSSGNGVKVLNVDVFNWSKNSLGGNLNVSFGGDKPHENRQPYQTVYIFRRTI